MYLSLHTALKHITLFRLDYRVQHAAAPRHQRGAALLGPRSHQPLIRHSDTENSHLNLARELISPMYEASEWREMCLEVWIVL